MKRLFYLSVLLSVAMIVSPAVSDDDAVLTPGTGAAGVIGAACILGSGQFGGGPSYTSFGWKPISHGSANELGASVWAMAGQTHKSTVYFAQPGDYIDSLGFYGKAASGTQTMGLLVYTVTNSRLDLPDDRVIFDTVTGITTTAQDYVIDVTNFDLTPKSFYCLVECSVSTQSVGAYVSVAGIADYMLPSTSTGDIQLEDTHPPDDPWGAELSTSNGLLEMWGVVRNRSVTAAHGKVSLISQFDTSLTAAQVNDSLIMNKPASMADDDVLFAALVKGDDNTAGAVVPPAGWRVLFYGEAATQGDDHVMWCGYKIIPEAGLEPATYAWTGDVEEWAGGIICLRNVDTTAVADCNLFSNFLLDVKNDDPTAQGIFTRTDSAFVVYVVNATATDTGSVTIPGGTTALWTRKATDATAFNGLFAVYDLQESKGFTGNNKTWICTDTTDTDVHSFTIAFRPK